MKKHFTPDVKSNSHGINILVLVMVLISTAFFTINADAANFEVDSTNVLPDGRISNDCILYAKLSPVRGASTDTCINGGFALSLETMTTWADYSCFIRFCDIGKARYIDVRDNAAIPNMVARDTVYFEFDEVYHFWIEIHIWDQTYTVYVQTSSDNEIKTIAENAVFRKTPAFELAYFSAIRNGDFIQTTAHLDILDLYETNSIGLPIGTEDLMNTQIQSLRIENFPNPFTEQTIISYNIPEKSSVKLSVFTIDGREVKTLVNQTQDTGDYEVLFTNENLSKGVYFCRLQMNDKYVIRKMIMQ